ncbi:MAG: hypothetical protein ACFFC3_05995 [Candidatus Odinarchaeota archaeon]
MQLQYKLIKVVCPRCGAEKEVPVPNSLFSQKKTGHVKIRVPKGVVCQDHVFIVFLNIEGKVIGYENVDLSISSITEIEPVESESGDETKLPSLKELIEMIGIQCLAGLLHVKLFDHPSFIILEKEFKENFEIIENFLDKIIPEKYKNIKSPPTMDFSGKKHSSSEYIYVMVDNQKKPAFLINLREKVVQIPLNLSLELEYTIINSVLEKDNPNEHFKFFTFYISKFLEDIDETMIILKPVTKISKKNLTKKLKEKAITSTVTKNYISIIREFIHQRITPEIAQKIQD